MLNKQLKNKIKDQSESIYDRIDTLAREQDSYDFGLPMFKKETGPIEEALKEYAKLWQAAEADRIEARKLLDEVFRKHESGLLPDRFVYEKIKSFLYPTPKTSTDDTE